MTSVPAMSLGPREVDALQEVASVGAGQAITALSRLVARPVHMDVPEVWIGTSPGAIADFLGALGQEILAVAVALDGLLGGSLVVALPQADAARLAGALGHPPATGRATALSESALLECANIVGSSFVSAVARMTNVKLLLGVPRLARGGGRACLDALVERELGRVALATRFTFSAPDHVEGLVLVMPEPARIPRLLAALPVPPWTNGSSNSSSSG
jgi:chemotaxis protein CheC